MFGGGSSASGQQPTSSGVSDLLLGATGGFPSSLGAPSTTNGFGNDITGSQQQQPGGSGGATTFDLSADFPSLGGGTVSSDTAGSNGLAAALRQQQQLLAHQQMLQGTNQKSQQQQQQQQQQQHSSLYRLAMQGGGTNGSNFNMATEDFPALPGAPPTSRSNTVGAGGSGASGSVGNLGTSSSSATSPSPQSLLMGGSSSGAARIINVGGAGAPGGLRSTVGGGGQDSSGSALGSGSQLDGTGLLGGTGLGGLGGLDGLQLGRGGGTSQPTPQMYLQASRSATPSSTSGGGASVTAGSALSGDYGLLGLLGVIRMTDADRNALALGSDLSLLGLSLGSSDQIFNTFSGPWSESSGSTKEPHFQVSTIDKFFHFKAVLTRHVIIHIIRC
jgi:CCR4-NOT transcription complex subunit 2